MKKFIASTLSGILLLGLTACGYDGGYRYSCQDPANWDKAECNSPICDAEGSCTKDLIGEKAWTEYQNSKGTK